ncbi:MAG TPA: DHA2 family efflux MFS transporter permease subunit [Anaerolineales bacterium]|nr:DHA2 family efflux MFS transporter permease subunit [Anaerolineales bacterium]
MAAPASNKWTVMLAVGTGVFLATLDGSIVNVALPTLTLEFRTAFAVVEWVVLAYLLAVATLLLGMGRLGDMLGKKPVYQTGFAVFTIGSVLCSLSTTIGSLIGFRILQAVGASMVLALGTAILTEAFPASERGKALGLSGTVVSIGIVVGPALGGFLLDALSWHWIFLVNLPVGIIGLVLVGRYVPSARPVRAGRFDLPGAASMFLCLLALLLALTEGPRMGFLDPRILGLMAASATFLFLFIRAEKRSAHPMVDLGLFREGLFSINLATGSLAFVALSGLLLLMPFYLEGVLGYPPHQVGLLMAAVPAGLGVTAPISGILSDRVGTRSISVAGLAVLLAGYVALTGLDLRTSALGYLARFTPIGVGMGLFQSPNNSAIMGTAPRERLGVASGLLALTRLVGQITGIAVLGALWASRTAASAGTAWHGDPSTAPAAAQVAGLRDTSALAVVLVGAALLLGGWALRSERGLR